MERDEQETNDGATVGVKLDNGMLVALDGRRVHLASQHGTPFSRSAVLRMALARFLGLIEPPPDDEEADPPA